MTPCEVAARIWFERYLADELTYEMEDEEFQFWMETAPGPCTTIDLNEVMLSVIPMVLGLAISRMIQESMRGRNIEIEPADRDTIRKERRRRQ
jgi:hypothetical protein